MSLGALERDAAVTLEGASPDEALKVDLGNMLYDHIVTEQTNTLVSDSDIDADDDGEGGLQLVEPIEHKSEFGNTELEDLVLMEGPQQVLQLILQDHVDDFMREEITDSDDYADWIKWVFDAKKGKHANIEAANSTAMPALLQVYQMNGGDSHLNCKEQLALSDNRKVSIRWEEIY